MSLAQFIDFAANTFFPLLWDRLHLIITAPFAYPEMVWILIPMAITLILMTFYFGRYRREELGWNTAVGNALVLLFVSINLFQKVYPEQNPFRALLIFFRTLFANGFAGEGVLPGIVAGALLAYALILLTADFFHWLPKKLAFFVSSGLPINILAYFGIIFVYSRTSEGLHIPIDGYAFLAFVILFGALFVVLRLFQLIEPHKDDQEVLEEAPTPSRATKRLRKQHPELPAFRIAKDSAFDDMTFEHENRTS